MRGKDPKKEGVGKNFTDHSILKNFNKSLSSMSCCQSGTWQTVLAITSVIPFGQLNEMNVQPVSPQTEVTV